MANHPHSSRHRPIAGGERTVETFSSVKKDDSKKYFFLLVDGSLADRRASDDLLHRFGRALGDKSALVRAYDGKEYDVYEEVIRKGWSAEEKKAIKEDGPFLLVIDRSFSDFDPGQHPYAIVWLQEGPLRGAREDELTSVLQQLAAVARDENEDLFAFITDLAERQTLSRGSGRARVWKTLRAGTHLGSDEFTGNDEGRK